MDCQCSNVPNQKFISNIEEPVAHSFLFLPAESSLHDLLGTYVVVEPFCCSCASAMGRSHLNIKLSFICCKMRITKPQYQITDPIFATMKIEWGVGIMWWRNWAGRLMEVSIIPPFSFNILGGLFKETVVR
jgi:hypothetical protein